MPKALFTTQRVLPILLVSIVLVAIILWSQYRTEPIKVSGYLEADEIRIGSRVGGRVLRVATSEGQRVLQGSPLVELEPFDLLERRANAAAVLEQKQASLSRLKSGYRAGEIAQAKARMGQIQAQLQKVERGPRTQEITAAQAELRLAKADLELAAFVQKRALDLFSSNLESRQDLDEANTKLKVAEETVEVRKERLFLLEEGSRPEDIAEARARLEEAVEGWKLAKSGYRKEEIKEAEAAVRAAEASLRIIERQVEELTVRAPTVGVVEAIELQPGDLVTANAPVVSLTDTRSLWVRAYVPENRLSLTIGQKVDVSVDSFPGRRFAGRVSFVARAAEFTPGNVQTPEERSKQVFRIKVTLVEGLDELRPGMGADVWLEEEALDR